MSISKPSFFIADPALQDSSGHYLEYDQAVALEALKLGFETVVLSHVDFKEEFSSGVKILPVFKLGMWEKDKWFGRFGAGIKFFQDLRRGLSSRADKNSIVFGGNVYGNQILGWALFALLCCASPGPRIIILLRYDVDFYNFAVSRLGLWILEKVASRAKVSLVTDSHRLANDFKLITRLKVSVLPIPHGEREYQKPLRQRKSRASHHQKSRKIRFVALGNAREEKGILEILKAIEILQDLGFDRNFEFVIQVHSPYPASISLEVERARGVLKKNVVFMDSPLNSAAYSKLLQSANVVLLPYWSEIYRSRSSGPFTEAVAAGKLVIASADTWMADFFKESSIGELCKSHNAADLASAIIKISKKIKKASTKRGEFQRRWAAYHNAENFMKALLDGNIPLPYQIKDNRSVKKLRNALVVLPWTFSSIKLSGAGVRIAGLIEFLSSQFDHVHLIEPDPSSPADIPLGVRTSIIKPDSIIALGISRFASEVAYIRHGVKNQNNNMRIWNDSWFVYWFLRYYFTFRAKMVLRDYLERNSISAIFVEYSFPMPLVVRAVGKRDIPIVVTNYDVLSKGIFDSWMRAVVHYFEIKALQKSDKIVAVTSGDRNAFGKSGLKSVVIPNSIDPGRLEYTNAMEVRYFLRKQTRITIPRKPIALFIGSSHFPNVEAAQRLKSLAQEETARKYGICFVVAGECAPAVTSEGYIALGRISDDALAALYAIADVVIVPLQAGTGSSIKTIEAMALGKVVIGTRVGFRGLNIRSAKEAIVEDELSKYPRIIAGLVTDKARIRSISKAARKFAENYNFRNTYRAYLDLIGLSQRAVASNSFGGLISRQHADFIALDDSRLVFENSKQKFQLAKKKYIAGFRSLKNELNNPQFPKKYLRRTAG